MVTTTGPANRDEISLQYDPFADEAAFYSTYDWSLDPHLTFGEAVQRLGDEIGRLSGVQAEWQLAEITTNVYLLSCSLLNAADEYLRGHTLRMPAQLARIRAGSIALWVTEQVGESLVKWDRSHVRLWKEEWEDVLHSFLAVLASGETSPLLLADSVKRISGKLQSKLPSGLLALRLGVPSAFSRLNMTQFDVLALGREFVRQYPDRSLPILLLGVRTAGTYFSALLRPFFRNESYQRVASLTVHPNKGPGRRERAELTRYAKQGFTVVIVDDPPHSGGAIGLVVEIARKAGYDPSRIKALVPVHRAARNWFATWPEGMVIPLEPKHWRKQQLLNPTNVENRLAEYFARRGVCCVRVIGSSRADDLNAALQNGSRRGTALKRIFEVQLQSPRGHETKYVLGTSVGLGYLGYPAFLAARRLSDFVPPLLGLRDGILYTEWLPQRSDDEDVSSDRDRRIDTAAAYIAARTRELSLPKDRTPGKAVHENGLELLAKSLARAYGRFLIDLPMRSWMLQRLCRFQCPFPTLIDGRMGRAGWIGGTRGLLKTGYHAHGLGKAEVNAVDPAYDLAETILSFGLSADEEGRLIRRYVEHSGDAEVERRLFINKLLAGLWTMEKAQEDLFDAVGLRQEAHRRFLVAWDFLTVQTARFCGARCRGIQPPRWRSPVVFLDVDGVLDRRIFGYPCTTAAGMEALSLLARGGYSVALNTARSASEVRDYCEAYGLAGGVAEHGAYLWDAVAQHGQCLLGQETLAQLDELRWHLRRTPGVFLDERHQYSIRAFTFEKRPASLRSMFANSNSSFSVGPGEATPLPTLLVTDLLTTLRLDRLSFHHTTMDTTIVAKDTEKGAGLVSLRDRVLGPDAETIAIGDTEADLPMFRSATRSFAPAQISCRQRAVLLGCSVSRYRYQRGLLDIVRRLANCKSTSELVRGTNEADGETLFLDLLQASDRLSVRTLARALFDRATYRIFLR